MSEKTSAQLCRENGWGVGTVLEGDHWRIRITAVGEEEILVRTLAARHPSSGDWRGLGKSRETKWELFDDLWKAVAAEPAAGGEEGAEREYLPKAEALVAEMEAEATTDEERGKAEFLKLVLKWKRDQLFGQEGGAA